MSKIVVLKPHFNPKTGRFTWLVDYDESIAQKIAVKDPLSLAWATSYATDDKFPDERRGRRIVSGRIWFPNRYMGPTGLEKKSGGILARPKEIIDFSKAFPRPALDNDMPLVAPGQCWSGADGFRFYLCLRHFGDKRYLDEVWLDPFEKWLDSRRFLVIEE